MVGTSNESDPGMAIELGNVCVCVSMCLLLFFSNLRWNHVESCGCHGVGRVCMMSVVNYNSLALSVESHSLGSDMSFIFAEVDSTIQTYRMTHSLSLSPFLVVIMLPIFATL